MTHTITDTNFNFPGQKSIYKGKVREVYALENDLLVMIATDRLSAFDVVMPKGIPYKGQILNQIATKMMEATKDIVPNWLTATPDPNVAVGHACEPFKVEMVIRGYMSGHAAREYKAGKRILCGVSMPEGLKENDAFPLIFDGFCSDEAWSSFSDFWRGRVATLHNVFAKQRVHGDIAYTHCFHSTVLAIIYKHSTVAPHIAYMVLS